MDTDLVRAAEITPAQTRAVIRSGNWVNHTSGLAGHYMQANVVMLPARHASEFRRYCECNPKALPLLAVAEAGYPVLPRLGRGIDVRRDLPRYRVWRDGFLVDESNDVMDLWRPDLVTFVIGSSFSFDQLLIDSGISVRHMLDGRNAAMYRTGIPTTPVGRFHGPMVVSMRPMRAEAAIRAIELTSRLPAAHGAPVHVGHPHEIGIADLQHVHFGEAGVVLPNELPVYWASGVTAQAAIARARLDFCITQAPGAMLVTDLLVETMVLK